MAAIYCRRVWVGERQYVANRHESYMYVSALTYGAAPRFRFIIRIQEGLELIYYHLSYTNYQ
jgi:hypothetical protein